ncbi:P-loop containing nucleoside triphosphate hydrolase [Gracilaria domingensis]|nr:P-loop containing nucleoside triphosphate hydrolase [Gracilaria domingensis]
MKPRKLLDNIGLVLQDPASYLFLPTVLDELIMGRPEKTPDDVRRVMAAVGLQNVSLLSNPRALSGGQVRRLALADQLMRDPTPALFALDEPLAGVDWTGRRQLADLLGSLKRKFAIVIISHEPGELLKYADRVIEVGRGGAYEIDRKIVKKAVRVRAERKKAAMEKARREAFEHMKRNGA